MCESLIHTFSPFIWNIVTEFIVTLNTLFPLYLKVCHLINCDFEQPFPPLLKRLSLNLLLFWTGLVPFYCKTCMDLFTHIPPPLYLKDCHSIFWNFELVLSLSIVKHVCMDGSIWQQTVNDVCVVFFSL
jgi:hypothetical protein